MSPDIVAELAMGALRLIILLVLVLIVPSMVVGVLVSLFQAATQINEQTMSFLPRLVCTLLVIGLAGHWVAAQLMQYTVGIFQRAAQLVG
ncbi:MULTISPECIES: flagellar biosynthetic protein FliQ [Pseudoxanthomonas]|jgi:Flagellar biosynthesis pathway, component FliQ|uniref:Flagellar biosynthetic protein FliQ n=1 Tax=Pseudoxanthomonas taiwanensis J19 TaxID=935569 RepID=A0A562E770_9GAMM|nr:MULTISPECIES: flagellar biosynthetic protein FliQ [Pseudoxanthomonas]RRN81025.1 flagellar biosynthetic protein FliQ [Pseudoxanthomonas sp. SGD-10]TWH17564.1 flagellar biosynthetic protein FliQ [Pseudoxanthomonas taiwanensis J19]